MLKLIVGKKGSGKTKTLLSMVNDAVEQSEGKVVFIDKGSKLTFNVHHGARLVDTDEYNISGFDAFYGFLAGIAACDFDVREIYVDSLLKICGDDFDALSAFFGKLEDLSAKAGVSFVLSVSAEAAMIPEGARQFIA